MNSFITQVPAEEQANILLMTNALEDSIQFTGEKERINILNKTWKINWATHSNSLEAAPECLQNISFKIQMHNNFIFSSSRAEGWAPTQNR